MKGASRYGEFLSLLNIEIDDFDKVNDTIGVNAGDEVLRLMAQRIQTVIRDCDVLSRGPAEEDVGMKLFHFGRSIFTLVLYRIESIESAANIASRIIELSRAPIQVGERDLYVTTSIGIATCPSEGNAAIELLRLASSAKDFAKKSGGNTFQSSSKEINEMYDKRLKLESQFRKAIKNQELEMYYQPKVDLITGSIVGTEALVRWHSDDGLVFPSDFIPLAEETGMIIPMGEWCLVESFRQLKEWQESDRAPITMSVNISAKQFDSEAFLPMLKQTVSSIGVDTSFLTLELTESLLIDNVEEKIKLLETLKEMGFKLSIDDFGTGYSSLSYLRRLPFDELKIDRSFIMEVLEHENSRAIVSTVVFLARSLNMLTVAEGVEEEGELEFLKKLGCDQFQGFLFGKAVPSDELFAMLPLKYV